MRRALIIMSFGLSILKTQAQLINMQNSIPVSPEAASMLKNVDIPMNYGSGLAQIGIPIGSVKSGAMEAGVSLSYNASGIRVEEVPTWVGLGWNLNAGGSVTRVIRGLPDESMYGFINSASNRTVKYVENLIATNNVTELTNIELTLIPQNLIDLEPDIFNFSAFGYSGTMTYNQDSAKFLVSPYQNIKLEFNGAWNITLPNGVKCIYGGSTGSEEYMVGITTWSYIDGVSYAAVNGPINNYPTAWMMRIAEDPLGKQILYNYVREGVQEFGRGGESKNYFGSGISDFNITQSFFRQDFYKPVLQSIAGESGTIYFKRAASIRQDMSDAFDGARSLDTIQIKNRLNQEMRSFHFAYDYTVSSDSTSLLGITNFIGKARRRLMLRSVTEKVGANALPRYEFTYHSRPLPNRLSASQDFWGYFNGKNMTAQFLMPRSAHVIPNGADRRIDTAFNQAEMLTKIKYPTGGITQYFYEPNDVLHMYYDPNAGAEWPDGVEKSYTFMPLLMESPPYPLYYTDTFRINRPSARIYIKPNLPPPCNPTLPDASCRFTIKVRSLPDSTVVTTAVVTSAYTLTLPEGKYRVEAIVAPSGSDPVPNFTVDFKWMEKRDPDNFWAGGLRVRKILSSDSLNNFISRGFDYKFNSSPTNSSGILGGFPTHWENVLQLTDKGWQDARYAYKSSSITPLTTDGQTVHYQFATEYYDTARTSFKTEYSYGYDFHSSSATQPLFRMGLYGGAPATTRDWQNNLLLRKRTFEKISSTYRELAGEWNYYTFYKDKQWMAGLHGLFLREYDVATEWYLLDSTVKISYAYGNSGQQSSLSMGTRQLYNGNFLPSTVRSVNSKGQVVVSRTWYPTDYSAAAGNNINTLYNKFIWDRPIKQETSINGKRTTGSAIKYDVFGLPVQVYQYENAPLTDTAAHSPGTFPGVYYVSKTNAYYDATGNLTQVVNPGTDISVLLWNNTGLYPIAQVKNADSASVAFSSFEIDGSAKWTVPGAPANDNAAFTGKADYSLSSGSITKSGLAAKTYFVSYWKKNAAGGTISVNSITPTTGSTSNGWTYYEHKIVNPASGLITVSGSATIDELRLYPDKALMTSYTIAQGVGMTSQDDPNSQVLKYEYDGLNRLAYVRDRDNNILKKICYSYTGHVVDCGYGTNSAWTAINSVCEQSGGVNTGNMIVTEKDLNPSSATYNQTRTTTVISNACPSCNSSNCVGVDKKCINNLCETGVRVNTGFTRINSTTWKCFYHYVWSDLSVSATYEELRSGPCAVLE